MKRWAATLMVMLVMVTAGTFSGLGVAEPKTETRALDPNQAGAPKNVVLNMDKGSSCKGDLVVIADQLIFTLQAPDPMTFPFPGCSMKPEFYKGTQLQNSWQVVNAQYDDALVKYSPPPSGSYRWIQEPSGNSPHRQVLLSMPACAKQTDPCWKVLSRTVSITIRGPADQGPYKRR
jgi:hypothetical protein